MLRTLLFLISGLVLLAGCRYSDPVPPGIARAEGELVLHTDTEVQVEGALPEALVVTPTPWRTLGKSVEGRPIRVCCVGSGPRCVLWIGGVHGDEREGHVATSQVAQAVADTPGLARRVTLWIVEDANPDGTAAGTRVNANGVDLNRNFPARNFRRGSTRFGGEPLSQPEARLLHDLVLELEPELTIAIHSWTGDRFINYDGPAAHEAIRFEALSGYRVRASDTFHTTPGSLGSWLGVDRDQALLTLEYKKGSDPQQAWEQTRAAFLAVIAGVRR